MAKASRPAWRASTRARRRTPGCCCARRARSSPTAAASQPATPSSPGRATPATARQHVAAALAAGASACLVEADGVEAFGFDGEPRVGALRGLKAAAGDIASRFLGTPSSKLDVVAVTGTNGKTSTAWWVAQALAALGRRCGVVGTLGIGEPPRGRGAAAEARAGDALGPA